MSTPIPTELAWRLRAERGLLLPIDREYEVPRVKEIALRQAVLHAELDKLDLELRDLAQSGPTNTPSGNPRKG